MRRASIGAAGVEPWLHTGAYTALGLLASVVVHSAARVSDWNRHTTAVVVYGGALLAGSCTCARRRQASRFRRPRDSPG